MSRPNEIAGGRLGLGLAHNQSGDRFDSDARYQSGRVDYDEMFWPKNLAQLKAEVARGYETARTKHPELPPSWTMREIINGEAHDGKAIAQRRS